LFEFSDNLSFYFQVTNEIIKTIVIESEIAREFPFLGSFGLGNGQPGYCHTNAIPTKSSFKLAPALARRLIKADQLGLCLAHP
jgi:hypothetical protein